MAAPAILKIDIIADAAKAQKALKGTADAADKTGSRFSKVGKAVAGGLAVGAVIAFGTSSVKAANESQKATKGLENVFRSMGDTTGTAAKAAEDYATSLQNKIGVDDDVIKAGQTQLATFSAVSSETARAAGIFDRATAAGADLAAAGFGSISSNAVQLGKALQDPTKGLTALGRSGVTFTKEQKAQIATMQKHGDLLGAQKVVLGAVEQQVKGTAEATATSSDKMNVAFGNTQETIGNALMPVLNALAPILQDVAKFIEENISWLTPLVGVIAAVVAIQWAWNAAMAANPLTLVVLGIAALIAGIILLVKNWDKVTAAFVWLWNWLKSNWPMLLAILTGPIGLAVLWIVRNWDKVKAAFVAVWNWIKSTWSTISSAISKPFTAAWDAIRAVWDKLWGMISGFLDRMKRGFGKIFDTISDPFRRAFNAIAGFWNSTVGALSFKVPGWVPGLGGKGFDVPDIPTLAAGGLVTRPTLALIGEAGPELVIPAGLLRGRRSSPALEIANATFVDEADLETLLRRTEFLVGAGRL